MLLSGTVYCSSVCWLRYGMDAYAIGVRVMLELCNSSGSYTMPLVENHRRVGESCCLYIQGQAVQNLGELACKDGGRSVLKTEKTYILLLFSSKQALCPTCVFKTSSVLHMCLQNKLCALHVSSKQALFPTCTLSSKFPGHFLRR